MQTKAELLLEISKLINVDPFYTPQQVGLEKSELELILLQLKTAERPKKIIGERPKRMKRPAEWNTHYRARMSLYIFNNTGVNIFPYSTVSARFLDGVADFLGV